uniref:G_PROTEIN_RECEP_F1_2 domain-containing protein n=2 Tax=Caenorhabditis japonica TaxID=281687 RepID=A0A8R1HYU2_CAEJA
MPNFQQPFSPEVMVKIYLITDCICLFLATLNITGNSIILRLFYSGRLDSRRNLRIILYIAVSDIAFSVSILPQVFYMVGNWEPSYLDYDAVVMAASGWPLAMFLKISLGLNVGAAIERIVALYFPLIYRKIDHVKCSKVLMTICVLFGSIDTILSILSFRFEQRINCSSIGCFVNNIFRTYWGASNMVCGVIIIVMTIFVFCKVQKLSRQSGRSKSLSNASAAQKFRQANRTTCGALLSCLFCLTIPSFLVSLIETLTGFSVFEKVGAFYIASLLSSGLMNCLIFLILNGSVKSRVDRNVSDAITTIAHSKPSKPTIFVDWT